MFRLLLHQYKMPESSKQEDVLIAVMGMTGSGKSSFIKRVTGIEDIGIGDGLCSETMVVRSYRTSIDDRTVVLVDTPGFDDTSTGDEEIGERIANWLSDTYHSNRLLNGILYLHPINANRIGGSSSRSLRLLREFCGKDAYKNIVLGMTFWDKVAESEGLDREQELINENVFWKEIIAKGARPVRMTLKAEDGRKLLQEMGKQATTVLEIQREMKKGVAFEDTTAYARIDEEMTKLRIDHAEKLRKAEADAALKIAIAEADRIFQEADARAIHQRRVKEHGNQVNMERQLDERRARMRLAGKERHAQRMLEAEQQRAAEQERNAVRLIEAEAEAISKIEAEIKEKEAATRRRRQAAQTEVVESQTQQWNAACTLQGHTKTIKNPVTDKAVLTRWCDQCLRSPGLQPYYVCTKCLAPDYAMIICDSCFDGNRLCWDDEHVLTRARETDTLEGCARVSSPSISLICDTCRRSIKGLYFHCCICDNDDFDMCLTCVLRGKACRNQTHVLLIGVCPTLIPSDA